MRQSRAMKSASGDVPDDRYQQLFPLLLERVEAILEASPACHDWGHTLRVLDTARRLAREEGADRTIVAYAAVLHDIGRPDELADEGRTCHAQRGAEIVGELLTALGIDDGAFVSGIAECVRSHRFRSRGNAPPASIEDRVVYDADKLDSIGAIGIGRAFHFAGRIGARVHNSRAAALSSDSYSREDSAYREYLVKLQHVREKMLTRSGKRMAQERHEFMVSFFDRICREASGDDLPGQG